MLDEKYATLSKITGPYTELLHQAHILLSYYHEADDEEEASLFACQPFHSFWYRECLHRSSTYPACGQCPILDGLGSPIRSGMGLYSNVDSTVLFPRNRENAAYWDRNLEEESFSAFLDRIKKFNKYLFETDKDPLYEFPKNSLDRPLRPQSIFENRIEYLRCLAPPPSGSGIDYPLQRCYFDEESSFRPNLKIPFIHEKSHEEFFGYGTSFIPLAFGHDTKDYTWALDSDHVERALYRFTEAGKEVFLKITDAAIEMRMLLQDPPNNSMWSWVPLEIRQLQSFFCLVSQGNELNALFPIVEDSSRYNQRLMIYDNTPRFRNSPLVTIYMKSFKIPPASESWETVGNKIIWQDREGKAIESEDLEKIKPSPHHQYNLRKRKH
jgi:hypothetical protein